MRKLDYLERQLDSVQKAINDVIERGQSYEITLEGSSRKLTRADLPALEQRERRLELRIMRLQGRGCFVGDF